jgi:alpha-1,3-rhamnosyl/mannosyltransferase
MSFAVGFDTSALDPSFKEHAARGIGRYVRELKRYFDSIRNTPDGGTPTPELVVDFFDHTWFKAPPMLDRLIAAAPIGRQTIRQQVVYPLYLGGQRTSRFNALHFPAHMDAPSWSGKPYVLTVLDLIPLVCRDLYASVTPTWRFRLARWLELRAIRGAALIVAISRHTARDVERILGVPPERIVVTPLGVDEMFFGDEGPVDEAGVRARRGIPPERPMILYVGGIDQRKNYRGLIDTFAEVLRGCAERGQPIPVLVLVGKIATDKEYPRLKAAIAARGVEDAVIEAGFVPDAELVALYRASAVFLFPSLYEGFGMPPLEALAAGLPVVSSGTSAMPEVIESAGLLYDPTDAVAGARAVLDVLSDSALRTTLVRAGRARAREFTWRRTGELTLGAYEALARRGESGASGKSGSRS